VIILDTNVLSELARPSPDATVMGWADALPGTEVATTAVTLAELFYGIARLPAGTRRDGLRAAVEALVREDLGGRVTPFDAASARRYADVVTGRERVRRPISVADAQIAAICLVQHAILATRNTEDFEQTGVALVNPWQA
jgi:predicted nucleic acid-binding protein